MPSLGGYAIAALDMLDMPPEYGVTENREMLGEAEQPYARSATRAVGGHGKAINVAMENS